MSGFSSSWLHLRESADHRSRDEALLSDLLRHLNGRKHISVLDLGCGTGSNLRALAPLLPMSQHWHLIDHDRALLDAAHENIQSWLPGTDVAELSWSLEAADLLTDIDRLLDAQTYDIVTAAALFDLVSADWITAFATRLAERGCVFYTVLIYDGVMRWTPEHEQDEAVRLAFNQHQQTDKGFGAAAGPDAGVVLAEKLEAAGLHVETGQSPWRLDGGDRRLMLETAKGIGQAAEETGLVDDAALASWRASRERLTACEIGHTDLLAIPG